MEQNYVTVTLCIQLQAHGLGKGDEQPRTLLVGQCYLPPGRGDIAAFTPVVLLSRSRYSIKRPRRDARPS